MFVNNAELNKIAEAESWKEPIFSELTGGDINKVFLVELSAEKFVMKINNADKFPFIFEAEAEGLNALRNSNSFKIPQVFSFGKIRKIITFVYHKSLKNVFL